MSATEDRLRVLRAYRSKDWTLVEHVDRKSLRVVEWLVNKGWLERHPTAFLSEVRITDLGYEVLAQAGGDVTGSGW